MQCTSHPPTAENPVVEPNTQAFLDELAAKGGPQIYELSVEDARGVLGAAQGGEVRKLPAEIEDRTIPGGPKGRVAIRIVRPKGGTGALPVVVYFHGGGWVLGDVDTHDRLIREIANGAQAAVVFVDYCRAPEARYPVAIEEAYAATKWVSENGKTIDVDSSRLAVAGDSVGGNMAAAVTLLAKQRGGPKIDFQLLFYPVTDADFDTPSYQQFAQGYFLTREAMKWFWDHYAPDVAIRTQPLASLHGHDSRLCDVERDHGYAGGAWRHRASQRRVAACLCQARTGESISVACRMALPSRLVGPEGPTYIQNSTEMGGRKPPASKPC